MQYSSIGAPCKTCSRNGLFFFCAQVSPPGTLPSATRHTLVLRFRIAPCCTSFHSVSRCQAWPPKCPLVGFRVSPSVVRQCTHAPAVGIRRPEPLRRVSGFATRHSFDLVYGFSEFTLSYAGFVWLSGTPSRVAGFGMPRISGPEWFRIPADLHQANTKPECPNSLIAKFHGRTMPDTVIQGSGFS